MKKMIKFLGCAALLAFAGDASAQVGLDGKFGSSDNGGGNWTVYCDNASTNCGVIGARQFDGSYYFRASDGSEWNIIMSSSPDDNEGLEVEFNNGVEARPWNEEGE